MHRPLVFVTCNLLLLAWWQPAIANDANKSSSDEPATATPTPQPATQVEPAVTTYDEAAALGYDDEPPASWPEREWRWRTRHFRPQRFARRDLDTRYGYDNPFGPYDYVRRDYYDYGPYGFRVDPADAYLQGRYDERQFREWKEHHDKGIASYSAAMADGLTMFREARYAEAVGAFSRAAELHQGDPASRVHATYALVAIGNYDDAVLMIRRAIQLQSRLVYLPLSIREEYGPQVDFDAHLQRLREATDQAGNDAGLWMLLAYYQHFSGDSPAAYASITRALELAPRDRVITDLHRALRLQTPSANKSTDVPGKSTAPPDKTSQPPATKR